MKRNQVHLVISPETKKLIMVDCMKEFRRNNPEFDGMKISQDFLLKWIGKVYLKI